MKAFAFCNYRTHAMQTRFEDAIANHYLSYEGASVLLDTDLLAVDDSSQLDRLYSILPKTHQVVFHLPASGLKLGKGYPFDTTVLTLKKRNEMPRKVKVPILSAENYAFPTYMLKSVAKIAADARWAGRIAAFSASMTAEASWDGEEVIPSPAGSSVDEALAFWAGKGVTTDGALTVLSDYAAAMAAILPASCAIIMPYLDPGCSLFMPQQVDKGATFKKLTQLNTDKVRAKERSYAVFDQSLHFEGVRAEITTAAAYAGLFACQLAPLVNSTQQEVIRAWQVAEENDALWAEISVRQESLLRSAGVLL